MKQVAVIGTSLLDQVIESPTTISANTCNKVTFTQSYGGSMHNVAWNLGMLHVETHFFSKFGHDMTALELMADLQKRNVINYGTTVPYNTPVFTFLCQPENSTMLSSITPEFAFHGDESLPYFVINQCDWSITDQTDARFLHSLLLRTPDTRWIFSGSVCEERFLPMITGMILNQEEFEDYAQGLPVNAAAKNCFDKGVQWLIITKGQEGALYIDRMQHQLFAATVKGDYPLGCGDAFLAGLTAGLVNGQSVIDSVPQAITAAGIILQQPAALSEDIGQLLVTS